MVNSEIERIVWIDPNLKTNFGHPIEGACSIKSSVTDTSKVDLEIVTNRDTDSSVQRLLGEVHPVITNTCFQNLDDKGSTFHEDMEKVHEKLQLGTSDLVVIPTAYSNEILGVKTFLGKHKDKQPKFAFQIHQFFPPALTFRQTLEDSYFLTNKELLAESFIEAVDFKNVVSIWTTRSRKLNQLLNSFSPMNIGMLPLPIEFHKDLKTDDKPESVGFTISFLGDGRYEKGLLLFLEAVKDTPSAGERIIIQDYNGRGYDVQESVQFKRVRQELESDSRVEFIESAIDPLNFQRIVATSDVVVMPYHPQSYDKRVSEIYIIARMYNQICVVSSGTWMADESRRFNAGHIFDYKLNEPKQTIDNLRKELEIIIKGKSEMKSSNESGNQSINYQRVNSPRNMLRQIIKHYE